jgi:hypothetical protein
VARVAVSLADQEEGGAGTIWQLVQGVTAHARPFDPIPGPAGITGAAGWRAPGPGGVVRRIETSNVEGSGFAAGALLSYEEVHINMKPKLVEVDFIFISRTSGGGHENRITAQAGLFRRKLSLSFSIGGPAEDRETLPAELVDAIKTALTYAEKNVRVQDLVEIDPEPEVEEDC